MENRSTNGNQKNLSLNERYSIESYLKEGLNFTEIAQLLGRSRRTIAREIKTRRVSSGKNAKLKKSKCAHLKSCKITNLCNNKYCKRDKPCSKCKLRTCSQYCDVYVPGTCEKVLKPPYVCNGCPYPRTCGYDKMYYRAKYADDMYHETMSDSRKGIDMSIEELNTLDNIISPLLKRGQSIAHIHQAHNDEINCSKRTLYNYVDQGILTAKNIDLPRKVRYKPRKKSLTPTKDQTYRKDRTYEDFLKYTGENPDINIVEMDIVKGCKSGKVILTLLFRNCNLMPMFLLDNASQQEVQNVFNRLGGALGSEGFKSTLPVILTDNGPEFKNPESIEFDEYGDRRSRVFFCEAYKSWQKARIEKNHEFIRYILPKGKSFNEFNQSDVTRMANHINSIARASLGGKTPLELADMLLPDGLLDALELRSIPPDEVLLKPQLLKR